MAKPVLLREPGPGRAATRAEAYIRSVRGRRPDAIRVRRRMQPARATVRRRGPKRRFDGSWGLSGGARTAQARRRAHGVARSAQKGARPEPGRTPCAPDRTRKGIEADLWTLSRQRWPLGAISATGEACALSLPRLTWLARVRSRRPETGVASRDERRSEALSFVPTTRPTAALRGTLVTNETKPGRRSAATRPGV